MQIIEHEVLSPRHVFVRPGEGSCLNACDAPGPLAGVVGHRSSPDNPLPQSCPGSDTESDGATGAIAGEQLVWGLSLWGTSPVRVQAVQRHAVGASTTARAHAQPGPLR